MPKKSQKDTTQLEHLGRASASHYGSVNMPVYRVSTALFPDLKSFRAQSQPMTYGRRATPGSQALTEAIAEIEGGQFCVLTPSGLSAVTCAILACVQSGGHILVADNVYQPTRSFCDKILPRMNVAVSYYDPIDVAALNDAIRPETSAIFVESPGSLTFEIQDIPAIADRAHKNSGKNYIYVIMDNTWATPLFFKPFAHGVDISVQAATKYICGHADLLLGTITANEKAYPDLRRMHARLGLCASGDDIYLTLRGLRTLDVRLQRHMETSIRIAEFLESRDEIIETIHPALPSHPQHHIWRRDFTGASGLFAARIKPCPEKNLAAMLDGFELFAMGYSWGGFESLIIPADPIRTINQQKNDQNKEKGQLIRIHAGLEDADDLIDDLKTGLKKL